MASKNKIIFDVLANTGNYADGMSKTVNTTEVATKAMKIAFVALSAVAIGATVAFTKFEKGMSNISTIIDNNNESIKGIGGEILKLSKTIPKPVGELVESMYDIRSAGVDAGKAMETLNSAGRLATVGLSTTKEATDILTTSINSFKSEGRSATEISNILFKTVKYGKNTIAELAQSFGSTAPLAKAAGTSLTEFSAGVAALTAQGIPASVAQNNLAAAMIALQKPTANMKKAFQLLGVKGIEELLKSSKNLGHAFSRVRDVSKKLGMSLVALTGRKEGANAMTVIATEGADIYTKALYDMEGGADAVSEAFKRQSETMDAQKQIMLNMINTVFINLGSKLAPALIKVGSVALKLFDEINEGITNNGDSITKAAMWIADSSIAVYKIFRDLVTITSQLWTVFQGSKILDVAIFGFQTLLDIAGGVVKIFKVVTTATSNLISGMGVVGFAIKAVAVAYGTFLAVNIAAGILKIVTATKAWKIAMFALNLVMKANPIALIVTAVIALAALVYDVIVNFNEWKLTFNSLINSVIIGWKKAKAIFSSDETKKVLNEEIAALEAQNQAIKAQTEALKARKEELKAKGMSSSEADTQAGKEQKEGKLDDSTATELAKIQEQEAAKTEIKKQGESDRASVDQEAKEASYERNKKQFSDEKAAAESKFNEDMARARGNEEMELEAKATYNETLKELDNTIREENLAIDDERKIQDEEREIAFQDKQLNRQMENNVLAREAVNKQKKEEFDQRLKINQNYEDNKLRMGKRYAQAKLMMDKFYNQQAVKGFNDNSNYLIAMSDSKNKTLAGIGKAAAIAKVAMDTPKAAMGAYSALAGIPIVGPALGIAAAAAAIAYGAEQIGRIKSQSYAVGTDSIPRDMLASVHQGEGIIPAKENQFLQSGKLALVSPDMIGSGGDKSTVENNYYTDVNFDGANINGDFNEDMAIGLADKIAGAIEENRFAGFPSPAV